MATRVKNLHFLAFLESDVAVFWPMGCDHKYCDQSLDPAFKERVMAITHPSLPFPPAGMLTCS